MKNTLLFSLFIFVFASGQEYSIVLNEFLASSEICCGAESFGNGVDLVELYNNGTDSVDITGWGKQGEYCAEYLRKGRPAFVEGDLKFSTWESEGQKKNKLEVVANTVQFLGSRNDSQGDSPTGRGPVSDEDDVPF